MSTPMEETFFSSDMDSYTINHYTEPSYNNANMNNNNSLDPRLLSSPQNTAIMSNESPHEHYPQPHLLSPSYNFNMPPQQQQFYDPASDLSLQNYEPMRHQMLGHRRSVSVPPEDLMLETVQQAAPLAPAMVFHRGGTPLGDSMGGGKAGGGDGVVGGGGGKKFLKKAAAAQKRQMQRHVPYPSPGIDRMGGVRRVQYALQNQGPTSAPQQQHHHQQQQQQQMAYLREEDVTGVMQEFHSSTPSPQFGGFDNVVSPRHRSSPAQMSMEVTDVDALTFGSGSDVDTAVLGMLGFTERLSKDCEAMREFLARGFKSSEEDEIERYAFPLPTVSRAMLTDMILQCSSGKARSQSQSIHSRRRS